MSNYADVHSKTKQTYSEFPSEFAKEKNNAINNITKDRNTKYANAKSNIENIANMTDEVLEGLKEHNQEALEAIGIPWKDAIGSAIEDFEKIKE